MADGPDLPRPSRAGWSDALSTFFQVSSDRAVRLCFFLPLFGAVLVGLVACFVAPDIGSPKQAGHYSSLFATSAQVLAAVLVALAVEARAIPFRKLNAQHLIAAGTLSYVMIGAMAAIVAQIPTLSSAAYKVMFILTLGAGGGALLSVLTVGYYITYAEARQLRKAARDGR
jgi:hypothetical protein